MFSIFFFSEIVLLMRQCGKYYRAGQATDDNIIRRMRFACWITKAKNTRSEHVILIFYHGNNGYVNASHCYVKHTLPGLYT
jgi:hypothetical protein